MKQETLYIVKKNQILNGIKSALEENINNSTIIKELMALIENNIETILEDDCEEYKL